MYFTRVLDYQPKAKKMAADLETMINEVCEKENAEFITFSVTNSGKAIAVFKKDTVPAAEQE